MNLLAILNLLLATSFCRGVIFQCTVSLLIFFLRQNSHVTEEATFYAYAIYGLMLPILLLLSARPIDRLPAFHLVLVGTTAAICVRIGILLLQEYAGVVLILMSLFLPVADGISSAGATLAMKRIIYARYAGSRTTQVEKLDFYMTVDYGLSNLGAAASSLCFVGLRHAFSPDLALANSMLLILSMGVYVVVLALSLVGFWYVSTADQGFFNPAEGHCSQTCHSPRFWSFMAICTLLIPVRTLFRHLDTTIPIYLTHVLGEHADFPYVQAINPMITVVGVSLMAVARYRCPTTAILCRGSKYWAIVAGSLICACSFIGLGLLLLVHGIHPMVATSAGIALFSVGEVYWSPIFTAYALSQAPEGQEATYTALAAMPSLAAKLPTSLVSNALIRHYCPENLPYCDGIRLWIIIGSIAFITPLALTACTRWLNRRPSKSKAYLIEQG
jgi:hypothetical protein